MADQISVKCLAGPKQNC